MLPVLIKPKNIADPQLQSTWAYYGARQLLDMMGLSYVEAAPGDDYDPSLVIDPAAGQICVNSRPHNSLQSEVAPDYGPIWPILRLQMEAVFAPDPLAIFTAAPQSLPVFGGVRALGGNTPCGTLRWADETYGDQAHLMTMDEARNRVFRVTLNAPVFETIGLYLSRFSWAANPGFNSFVRYIDSLWAALDERWGDRPVVSDYQDIFTAILRRCYDRLGLVMATKWFHPAIDGDIKLNGMLLSHDVDSVYADKAFRDEPDQSENSHFNFARWQELENRFGIKSAFYFFSPAPSQSYWLPQPSYLITDEPVLAAARELAANGWEIAPHELGHRTPAEVADEVAYFEQVTGHKPLGTRNHVLTHYPDSLKYKAAASLLYDSTWYAEQTATSFLCGSALPFAPLDTATGLPTDIWEFPFVIEDGIVTGGYCAGTVTERDTPEAIADGVRGLDAIIAHNGYACFNWHQRTFAIRTALQSEPDNWVTILEGLLTYYQTNAPKWWNPLPGELAEFWSRRAEVHIESTREGIFVRNLDHEDCTDFVLALHTDQVIEGGEPVPQRGVICLASGVEAGEQRCIDLPAPL